MLDELENEAAEEEAAAKVAEDQAAENQNEGVNEGQKSDEVMAMEEAFEELKKENVRLKSGDGRKKYEIMAAQQAELLSRMETILSDSQAQSKSEYSQVDEDEPLTMKTFKQLIEKDKHEQSEQNVKYARGYESELRQIGATIEDEETHLQVMKLVTEDGSEFNVKSNNDPSAAAQINYYKALNSLKGKSSQTKPNLKGDKNLPPAGSHTKTNPRAEPEMVFDQETLDYMERTGMTEKEARKLMKV